MIPSGIVARSTWSTASRYKPLRSRSATQATPGPSATPGAGRWLPRPQRPVRPAGEQQQQVHEEQQPTPAQHTGTDAPAVGAPGIAWLPQWQRQQLQQPQQQQHHHQHHQQQQQSARQPPIIGADGPPPPRRPRQRRRLEPHPWEVVIVGPHNAADRTAKYLIGLLRHAETQHAQQLALRKARKAAAARGGKGNAGGYMDELEQNEEVEEGPEGENEVLEAASTEPSTHARPAPPPRRGMRGPPRVVLLATIRPAHQRVATLLTTATHLLESGHERTLLFQPLADLDNPATMHVFTWLTPLEAIRSPAAGAAVKEATDNKGALPGPAEQQDEGQPSVNGQQQQQQQQQEQAAAPPHPLLDLPTRKDLICSSTGDAERLGRAVAAEVTFTGAARLVSAGGPASGNALVALSHARHSLLQSSRGKQDLVVHVAKRYGGAAPMMGPTGPSGAVVYVFTCVACLGSNAPQLRKANGGRGTSGGSKR